MSSDTNSSSAKSIDLAKVPLLQRERKKYESLSSDLITTKSSLIHRVFFFLTHLDTEEDVILKAKAREIIRRQEEEHDRTIAQYINDWRTESYKTPITNSRR